MSRVFEQYISDVPAIPDPDFESLVTDPQPPFDEWFVAEGAETEMSDALRDTIQHFIDAKQPGPPKVPTHSPRELYERWGAQRFVDDIAVYDQDGILSIDLTSKKVGIPYTYEMRLSYAMGEIVGLPGSAIEEPIEIHLKRDHYNQHLPKTFGHEIGHYFWRSLLGLGAYGYDRVEEDFCDYFGGRMAMPERFLRTADTIDEAILKETMVRFGCNLNDVIYQFMDYDILPTRVAVDSYTGRTKNPDYSQKVNRHVFCEHCQLVGGDFNCPETNRDAPLFNFTEYAWSSNLNIGCLGEDLHRPEIMSTLTKYYVAKEAQLVLFRPGAVFEYDPETGQ